MTAKIPSFLPDILPLGNANAELSPQDAVALQQLRNTLVRRSADHLGYPYNFDHSHHLGPLHDLLRFSINNLGDPFDPSNYEVQSRSFEVDVIATFAQLWGLKPGDYWGCVAHSGTEGNRICLDVAGRVFPDATVLYSSATHYSIPGCATSYKLKSVCIPVQVGGEIDYFHLAKELARIKHRGKTNNEGRTPVIIVLNIGTTMMGAFDDVSTVVHMLKTLNFDIEKEVFIHLDGALSGLMVPFMDFEQTEYPVQIPKLGKLLSQEVDATEKEILEQAFAALPSHSSKFRAAPDFRSNPFISSYSCSGHKFLGCPMPAGIVVVPGKWIQAVHEEVEYLGDTKLVTSMGSRNGHSPIFLWHELKRKGAYGLSMDVQNCLENAKYFFNRLVENKISAFRNPFSNTVVIERPNDHSFVLKYHLACQKSMAHVVVMPSVTKAKLDQFVQEFTALKAGKLVLQCIEPGTPVKIIPDFGHPCIRAFCGDDATCFCEACASMRD